MLTENSLVNAQEISQSIKAGNLNRVNDLSKKDIDWASKTLEQAFYKDPMLNFIYGDTINKPGRLNSFFRTTLRLSVLYGESLGTAEKDGVLMMLPPDKTKMTIGMMLQSGILAAPLKMGWASFSRMMAFMDFSEKEHKAATSAEHYYIMTVGVLPERQGMGVGKKLMIKALEIVDTNHKQCYLETQNQTNVPIYEKFGFEVVSDKEIPGGGLHNWGMLRKER